MWQLSTRPSSLLEEVTATESTEFRASFSGPIDARHLTVDESNLVIRAARAVAAASGYTGGAGIQVVRRVPIAGGMGGGSADAGRQRLVAVDALWGTNLGMPKLAEIGATLGADVPFALHGGTALGLGRGISFRPVLAKSAFHWVLVLDEVGLSTPDVPRQLDRRHRAERSIHIETVAIDPEIDPKMLSALHGSAMRWPSLNICVTICRPRRFNSCRIWAKRSSSAKRTALWRESRQAAGRRLPFSPGDEDSAAHLAASLIADGRNAISVSAPALGAR